MISQKVYKSIHRIRQRWVPVEEIRCPVRSFLPDHQSHIWAIKKADAGKISLNNTSRGVLWRLQGWFFFRAQWRFREVLQDRSGLLHRRPRSLHPLHPLRPPHFLLGWHRYRALPRLLLHSGCHLLLHSHHRCLHLRHHRFRRFYHRRPVHFRCFLLPCHPLMFCDLRCHLDGRLLRAESLSLQAVASEGEK